MPELDLMAGVSDPTPGITPAKIPSEPVQKEAKVEKEVVKEVVPEPVVEAKEEPPKKMSVREAVQDAREKAKKVTPTTEPTEPVVKTEAKEPVVEKKDPPPVGWAKEAKDKWDSLDKDIQQSILKREKEVADGFKGTGEAKTRLKTIDSTVEKFVPDYKNFGGQEKVIENTLSWVQAFRNPNKQFAATQLLAAAQSFGILDDVKKLVSDAVTSGTQTTTTTPAATTTTTDPKVAELERKLATLESSTTQQQMAVAKATIDDWSKDKPHFEKLRTKMTELLTNGIVKMDPSGQFTKVALDEAYSVAERMDTELYAENIEKERKRIADEYEAKMKAANKVSQVQNSKVASSSIKTSPPAAKVALNGAANAARNKSAKDSIRAAIKEVRTR